MTDRRDTPTASTDSADPGPLRLGIAAPLFAGPGIPTMRTPSLEQVDWPTVRECLTFAERLGYESAWFSDHLFHGRDGAFFESWTSLCIAAGFTDRISLVSNHLGNGIRDARVVAKMATSLAHATGGRFDLFLGRGYREREYTSYGLEWEDEPTRARKLSEALDVVHALWSGRPTSFAGEFYELHDAVALPTTIRPPFTWVGGPVDRATLDLIALRADGWCSFPASIGDYTAMRADVDAACARAGRDPATLRRALETQILILEDEDEWPRWLERWRRLREYAPLDALTSDIAPADADLDDVRVTDLCRDQFIVGTRPQVAARIATYRDAGVTDLVCWFMDAPDTHSLQALAEIREGLG